MKRILTTLSLIAMLTMSSCTLTREKEPYKEDASPIEVKAMLDNHICDTTLTVTTSEYKYTFDAKTKQLISKDENGYVKEDITFIVVILVLLCFLLMMLIGAINNR